MKKRRMKVTQISRAALLFLVNYDRERFDVDPLTERQQDKIWQRAQKHAPAATETTVCLALTPSEIAILNREGYKTKAKYITF